MESTAIGTLMPLLDAAQGHPVITAKASQLIAELAKAGQQLKQIHFDSLKFLRDWLEHVLIPSAYVQS